MPYFVRIPGNCVRRIPMKPVSRMTSRISVNGTGGKEFHKFEPSAHRTCLLAGSRHGERTQASKQSAPGEHGWNISIDLSSNTAGNVNDGACNIRSLARQ